MRSQRWLVVGGCLALWGSSAVQAAGGGTLEGGTISVMGAVVAPTCSIAANLGSLSAVISASERNPSQQENCTRAVGTAASAPDPSRIYEVNVDHLSASEPDQVLNYFAGYVRAAQPSADPVLLTQSFE
jgi:type 1 fimbria pilin